MFHCLALATLATEAQIELKTQQVWTPLGLSDELIYTNTHHLDSISTSSLSTPLLLTHTLHFINRPWGFSSPNQVACKERKKTVLNKSTPPPTPHTRVSEHTTHHFAREEACPAQLCLSPLPSNNHDLHALTVRPLLLPGREGARDRIRERKREKSNKRP